ncbi:MAG: hypothetical protein K5776_08320 [Lachnospiraceae bacterium]|nr:hypothetical protein [Lachnospiraceae bacterium]
MKCCSRCLDIVCRCSPYNTYYKEIDHDIYPAVREFERKGYRVEESCSGNTDQPVLNAHITFFEDVEFEFKSDLICFETYNYNGFHIRKYKIVPSAEQCALFKKKRPNKATIISAINREFYRIALEAPVKDKNPLIYPLEFPQEYFTDESCLPTPRDIQYPWMLIKPISASFGSIAKEFFILVGDSHNLYERIVNKGNDFRNYGKLIPGLYNEETSENKILFDSTSLPEIIQFGTDRDFRLEVTNIKKVKWFLSYVAVRSEGVSLDISEDITDFLEDNGAADLLTVFEYGFNKLVRKNVHICAFSSNDTVIVFSDRIDFAYKVSKDGTALIFGPIDFDDCEFEHMSVEKPMCYIFANGTILLGKEISENA